MAAAAKLLRIMAVVIAALSRRQIPAAATPTSLTTDAILTIVDLLLAVVIEVWRFKVH